MGEEYGEVAPFLYFTDHQDPGLARSVTEGRRAEFASFAWAAQTPDPQAKETFLRSKLDHALTGAAGHRELRSFYQECLRLRRSLLPHFAQRPRARSRGAVIVSETSDGELCLILCLAPDAASATLPAGRWAPLLDSRDTRWGGQGGTIGEATVGGAVDLGGYAALLLRRSAA